MNYMWISQNPQNSEWLANTVLQKSQDQYKQLWSASVHESSKCVNYRIFKTEHKFENYLLYLPFKLRKSFGWLVVLRLNVPFNNFSVMSGRSHRFLGN